MPKGIPKNGINKGWFGQREPWNKGFKKKRKIKICKICEKEYDGSGKYFCSIKCSAKHTGYQKGHTPFTKGMKGFRKGHIVTEKTKDKIRNSLMGRKRDSFRGENNPNWKGGISKVNNIDSFEWNKWRRAVFKRDNYECKMCFNGNKKGNFVYLEPHHIKKKSEHPELIYDINNGITLCTICHNKIQWKEEEYKELFINMLK